MLQKAPLKRKFLSLCLKKSTVSEYIFKNLHFLLKSLGVTLEIKISQYADDTIFILNGTSESLSTRLESNWHYVWPQTEQ